MSKFKNIIVAVLLLMAVSCIKNDVPYPYQPLYITSITGDGFSTSINELTLVATLNLEETTDIRNVVISSATCTDEAKLDRTIEGSYDFTNPLEVTLYNYQSYNWTIQASQTIERYITAIGQIGSAVFDEDAQTVRVVINDVIDPEKVEVTSLKLGPEGITEMSPELSSLDDFSGGMRKVYVTYHGRTEEWKIYASFEEATVDMTLCTFLATTAWLETSGDTSMGDECGYQYRKVGDVDWTPYPVTNGAGGTFSATISGLTPNTQYEIKSYIGEKESSSQFHTTESKTQLGNSDFEEWYEYTSSNKRYVYPYLESDTDPVWGSGNPGAASYGYVLTEWSTDTPTQTNGDYSAQLTSQNAVIMFAAGNIFTGSYAGTIIPDGVIEFGYPFVDRPFSLKGWYKYNCGVIDMVNDSKLPALISSTIIKDATPDIGTIYIALIDREPVSHTASNKTYPANEKSPVFVYTGDYSTLFDPTGDDVIAYGAMQITESVDWSEFDIELEYYDRSRKPTHIMIVASASLYGDYFTGSTDSQMWLDDFELIYE